jgi:hypothetical protein
MGGVKHTPGPWTFRPAVTSDGQEKAGGSNVIDAQGRRLCCIVSRAVPQGCGHEYRQNGRLMASAPDLLAACVAVVRWFDEAKAAGHGYTPTAEMDAVRRAIAKAIGEPSP